MIPRPLRLALLLAALALLAQHPVSAGLDILHASYRPDWMLPEWNYFYSSSYKPGDVPGARIQGGHICVYLYNNGTSSVTVDDLTINGQGLKNGILCDTSKAYRCDLNACSVYYGGSGPRTTLINAGEPVWWRIEPSSIPAGGVGEVVVRMRSTVAGTLSCNVVPTSGSSVPVSISVSGAAAPRIVDHCYQSGTNKLYLYLRHPQKGKVPTAVYLDQNNVTSNCTFAADTDIDVVSVKISLSSALSRGSYHVFRADYDDGSKASFGLRVYSDGFKYATFNAPDLANETEQRDFLLDLARHSVNLLTMGTGSLSDYLKTTAGKAILDQYGIKKSHEEKTTDRLYSIFTCDEPDCGEPSVSSTVAPYNKTGTLAQSMIYRIRDSYRGSYAIYPTLVNVDGSDCPYNWYTWGHVADMFCHDGYYLSRLNSSYDEPWRLPFFMKCTWRYASAQTAKVACEPRREHIIMECVRWQEDGTVKRWPTPAENHIMAYYSIAAGAKELGYWWLVELNNTSDGSNGLADQPGSVALWREMGLVGAELGTVGNLIVNSTPAVFPVTAPGNLWVRSLVSGVDTIMLICVNDDYTNDQAGTIIRPVQNAQVSFDLPSWLASPTDVFEVNYNGIHDVSSTIAGGKLTMELGKVDVTRMLIITKDSTLRSTLQSLYTSTYGPRVAELMP